MLELRKILGRNGDVAERTESCGHSVNRSSDVFHLGVQEFTAFYDGLFSFFAQAQTSAFRNNGFDCFN
jgi:hypothetical protein